MSSTTSPPPELLSPELLARLDRLEIVSRKIFRGRMKGERRSRRKGQSVEFADFRSYVPGDDLRFIDWNLYARLDRLFLKMFLEEEDLHFYVVIDASESMEFGEPSKLFYAKQLAAALGYVALCRADRVRIETLGQPLRRPAPVLRGRQATWRLLDHLHHIQPTPAENVPLVEGLKNFCLRNSGKGVLVLLTDLMDKTGYEAGLRYLVAQQLDVYLIQVLSPEELNPDVAGDLKLIDCEDQNHAEITASKPLLDRYHQTLNAFVQGARQFCQRRGMGYVLANPQIPIEKLVGSYLRQQGMVR